MAYFSIWPHAARRSRPKGTVKALSTTGLFLNRGQAVSNASTDKQSSAGKVQTMHGFMDAKLMAKLLRQGLADHSISITHSQSLELVARQLGVANWNILSARIDDADRPPRNDVPQGWIRTGRNTRYYRTGVDRTVPSAWIECLADFAGQADENDFCTLMQVVDATRYRGKRIRVRCLLRSERSDGVTIFFRIDGPAGSMRFENLQLYEVGGPLKGTQDWTQRQIVLDVPSEATSLNYGFLLTGAGRGWAKSFEVEPVENNVPLNTPDGRFLSKPTNLGFEA